MIGYRDMTFCVAECENHSCHRQITDEVKENGAKWWGGKDFPISVSNFAENCDEYIPTEMEKV